MFWCRAQKLALDFCVVLARLRRRGVVQMYWPEDQASVAEALSKHEHVMLLPPDMPHEWLFPRCSVVRPTATPRLLLGHAHAPPHTHTAP